MAISRQRSSRKQISQQWETGPVVSYPQFDTDFERPFRQISRIQYGENQNHKVSERNGDLLFLFKDEIPESHGKKDRKEGLQTWRGHFDAKEGSGQPKMATGQVRERCRVG